ncbi:MAG: hypothetical protein NC253_08350 [Ruminococcus sp.]|nr:hypothetical protein [Ruminococcus sp.]MCM1480739.1 hypothetical protein [Muribaculaceae bacterium]
MDKSSEKIKKLKESILSDGCINSLHVWDGILLDGYDRYEICVSNGISFEVCEMSFKSRNETIEWICVNQLKRKDLTLKKQKYLMGKLYIVRKNIGIGNGIPTKIIQKLFSEAFKRNSSTVNVYSFRI